MKSLPILVLLSTSGCAPGDGIIDTAAIYDDGCSDGRAEGSTSGSKDGAACKIADPNGSNDDLTGDDYLTYCADAKDDVADPCISNYREGYLDCYYPAYSSHYDNAFEKAGCD